MNKNEFYAVKEFADTFGITPKTLKFYEQEGIFVPAYINPSNEYRHYHYCQISEFTLIMAMKNLGFTIGEIRAFLHDSLTVAEKHSKLLEQKKF